MPFLISTHDFSAITAEQRSRSDSLSRMGWSDWLGPITCTSCLAGDFRHLNIHITGASKR